MLKLQRAEQNPLITPDKERVWESAATFNPSVIFDNGIYHMVFRALTPKIAYYGVELQLSTIGYAVSTDGIHFTDRKQLILPEHDWEFYGCEDPRITKIDDTFYIFYTALSTFPFSASGIKVGVAITKDFQTIEQKHLVTPFNAKAMSLFPEKINGKLTAILTVDTDKPPSKIGIAYFDRIEEIWSHEYWDNWYNYIADHTLHLTRNDQDHVEIGAPPVKTESGWLLIYSYIKNYFSEQKIFTIESVILHNINPLTVVSRTTDALLLAEESYEKIGIVPNIVFPSGALVSETTLSVYYGGADTVSCLATCNLSALLREMQPVQPDSPLDSHSEIGPIMFTRFDENPILTPQPNHAWESMAVFNPAAFYEDGKVHLVYRASSQQNISTLGYVNTQDGFHITKRGAEPVYVPSQSFEMNAEGKNYGCEDPRITKIDERLYMCYTAYDGQNPPRVALTSLSIQDFLSDHWNWTVPVIISPPGIGDKDACLFSKKIQDQYVFLHRIENAIWLDYTQDLSFANGEVLTGTKIIESRPDKWDMGKIGIASPPIETKDGWILLYHGVNKSNQYNVGALLMDLENPKNVLARLDYPILTPEMGYEKEGVVPNVVFPCGAVIHEGNIIMYYGGADKVIGVASISLIQLTNELLRYKH